MPASTALVTPWVSNTAAEAMRVPIALAVVNRVLERRTGLVTTPQRRKAEIVLEIAGALQVTAMACIVIVPLVAIR